MCDIGNRPGLANLVQFLSRVVQTLHHACFTIALDDGLELSPSIQLVKLSWDLQLWCIVLVGTAGVPADGLAPRETLQ